MTMKETDEEREARSNPASMQSQPWPPPILPVFPPDKVRLGVEEQKIKGILERLEIEARLAQRISAKLNSIEFDPIKMRPKLPHLFEVKLILTVSKKVCGGKFSSKGDDMLSFQPEIEVTIKPEYEYGFEV